MDSAIIGVKIALAVNILWTLLPEKWFLLSNPVGKIMPIRGMGANISTNCTLLSLMACFALINFQDAIFLNLSLLLCALIAIVKTRGGAGLGAFLASMCFFFWAYFGFGVIVALTILSCGIIAIIIVDMRYRGCFQSKENLKAYTPFGLAGHVWNPSGRLEILEFANKYILPSASKWFGIGIGAFHYIMPTTQVGHVKHELEARARAEQSRRVAIGKPMNKEQIIAFIEEDKHKLDSIDQHKYIWAHNDIVQLYIEGGLVGVILCAALLISLLVFAIMSHNMAFIAFVIAFIVNCAANFPCHLAPDSILAIIMIRFLLT